MIVVYPILAAYYYYFITCGKHKKLSNLTPAFRKNCSHLAGLLRRRDPSTNPGRQRGAYLWAAEEMLCGMFVSATKGAEW